MWELYFDLSKDYIYVLQHIIHTWVRVRSLGPPANMRVWCFLLHSYHLHRCVVSTAPPTYAQTGADSDPSSSDHQSCLLESISYFGFFPLKFGYTRAWTVGGPPLLRTLILELNFHFSEVSHAIKSCWPAITGSPWLFLIYSLPYSSGHHSQNKINATICFWLVSISTCISVSGLLLYGVFGQWRIADVWSFSITTDFLFICCISYFLHLGLQLLSHKNPTMLAQGI